MLLQQTTATDNCRAAKVGWSPPAHGSQTDPRCASSSGCDRRQHQTDAYNQPQVAEKLYQRGFLSYPRTETDQYDAQFDFKTLVGKQRSDSDWGRFASQLLDDQGAFDKPRNGQKNDKAHPPIHPTAHANGLTGDDKKVYDYVTRRFLASCSKDAIGEETKIDLKIADELFTATGTSLSS